MLTMAMCFRYSNIHLFYFRQSPYYTVEDRQTDRQTDNRNKMHKAKHQLHIRYANRLHVFNNMVSAIDPLLTVNDVAFILIKWIC